MRPATATAVAAGAAEWTVQAWAERASADLQQTASVMEQLERRLHPRPVCWRLFLLALLAIATCGLAAIDVSAEETPRNPLDALHVYLEPQVLAFLNGQTVVQWAKLTLGQ